MTITPVFATDAKGKMTAVQSTSARGGFGQIVPGALMPYALPDKLPEPQVITKEVVKEVPKEVVKEVPKEVTRTVTVETISPVSYAAIGVGVVLVVIAGVLFTRGKKA